MTILDFVINTKGLELFKVTQPFRKTFDVFECSVCRTMNTDKNAHHHLNTRHAIVDNVFACLNPHTRYKTKDFKCMHCNDTFCKKGQLTRHIKTHVQPTTHTCKMCKKTFYDMKHSIAHAIKSHSFDYACIYCGQWFYSDADRSSHVDGVHKITNTHTCPYCFKSIPRRSDPVIHIRMHFCKVLQATNKCYYCPTVFNTKTECEAHIESHFKNKKTCAICNRKFMRVDTLRVHERIHTGIKPHKCNICHRRFTQRASLDNHLQNYVCTKVD